MKRKMLLFFIFTAILIFTLLPLNSLNADPAGTSLIVSKDITSESEGYITWDISKSADQTFINLTVGQTATVNYTVTVEPAYHEVRRTVSGNIHIINSGGEDASITYVRDRIEYKIGDGSWTELTTVGITTIPFSIPVGGSSDIPYSFSFTTVEGATDYRNTAIVSLENYEGGVGPHEFEYTTEFSNSGGTILADAFADVYDSLKLYLGLTWVGNPATYSYTYSWSIGPFMVPGDYAIVNTATVEGTTKHISVTDSLTIEIHVVEPPAKSAALAGTGIPGKGLDTAPGQQKPFNPNSQALENAGKKK